MNMSKKTLAIAGGAIVLIAGIIVFATRSADNNVEDDEWHGSKAAAQQSDNAWNDYEDEAGEDEFDEVARNRNSETTLNRAMEMTKPTHAPVPAPPPAPPNAWREDQEAEDEWGQNAEDVPQDNVEDLERVEQPMRGLRGVPTPVGEAVDDPTEDQEGLDPTEDQYDDPGYDDPTEPEDENYDDDEIPEDEE